MDEFMAFHQPFLDPWRWNSTSGLISQGYETKLTKRGVRVRAGVTKVRTEENDKQIDKNLFKLSVF